MPSFPWVLCARAPLTGGARSGTGGDATPRVLVVTGASSGIGRAVARQAARTGDHLVLVARDEEALRAVADECEAAGAASTSVLPTDVGDDQQVATMVARALERHGRIDAVAHLAGVVAYGRLEDIPQEVFDGVLRTNLIGSANVGRRVLPVMRRQGRGTLLLTGSLVGHLAVPELSPYVVSKWGVRALARELQLENRDVPGVRVGYVAPGPVLTPIWGQAANYTGWAGHPPPPTDPPEKVARVVLQQLHRPRRQAQVGLGNGVARLTFSALPRLHDMVMHRVVRIAVRDLTAPEQPHPGNVLSPRAERHQVRDDYGSPLGRISRGLGTHALNAVRGRTA
jgi:short-subunit dehydrogenase